MLKCFEMIFRQTGIIHSKKKLFAIVFVMGDFTVRLLKNIFKKKSFLINYCLYCTWSERENEHFADILLMCISYLG